MPSIQQAYNYCVDACNSPTVGYSQNYRNKQTINGITYYDCSSLMWYSLQAGGFDLAGAGSTSPFTTYIMDGILSSLGFVRYPADGSVLWLAGDIGWTMEHTEMVYQPTPTDPNNGGICMGAHTNTVPLANQVSIGSSGGNANWSRPYVGQYSWTYIYRYGNGADPSYHPYQWINGGNSEYFGDPTSQLCGNNDKAINNACCILQFFAPKGWSIQAIAALCGNVQQESTFNPDLIEIGGTGHGLVQWTPPDDLYHVLDVLYGSHSDWYDGDKQCNVIWAEYEQKTGIHDWGIEGQWYSTAQYPMTWEEWAHSTEDPGYLALAFQANYERPASLHQERAQFARWWYDYLKNIDIHSPDFPYRKGKMPLWMMLRRRRF